MKMLKKLYVLAVLVSFIFPINTLVAGDSSSSMIPITGALNQLLSEKYSKKSDKTVKEIVKAFRSNQTHVAKNFNKVLVDHVGATIVKSFDIPKDDMEHIKEKLSPFTSSPVFYRTLDSDVDPIPMFQAFKGFEAVGFLMNKAAEKVFSGKYAPEGSSTMNNFDRSQMQVMVDHECLHVKHGDGDLKVLCHILCQYREEFSPELFDKIVGLALGQDYLSSRKTLSEAIVRDAQNLGVHDLNMIENFDLDAVAFERYYETRVDNAILACGDRSKIEAYRNYYRNREKSPFFKERELIERNAISKLLKQGRAIPQGHLDLGWPTDKERADACDKVLTELTTRELLEELPKL